MRGPQKLQRKHGARPYLRTGRRCPLPLKTLPRSHHPRTGCDAGGRRRREFPAAGRNEHTGYQLLRRGVPRLDPGPLRLDLRRPRPSQRRRASWCGWRIVRPTYRKLLPELRRIAPNLCVKNSPLFDVGETFRLFGPCRTEVVSLHDECKEVVVYADGTGPLLTAVALELGEFFLHAGRSPCNSLRQALRSGRLPLAADPRRSASKSPADADLPARPCRHLEPERLRIRSGKVRRHIGPLAGDRTDRALQPQATETGLSGSRLTILKQDFPLTAAEIAARLGIREGGERRIAFTKLGQDYWTIRLK